jgi:hypothetical protein
VAKKKKNKTTKKTKKTTKKTAKKKVSVASTRAGKVTEIVFSYAEIDFLRKITKKDFDPASARDREARLSLRDKLLDLNFTQKTVEAGGLIVLELKRPEVGFLQRITKEVYSFITAEERRARLILREKILIAVEKLTGRKVRVEG